MKITAKRQAWIEHIKAWQQTSLSMVDYAKQHKLNVRHFYHIKSDLLKSGLLDDSTVLNVDRPRGGFTKVQVLPKTPPADTRQCSIKMPSGLALQFDADLPTPTLRSIMIVLSEAAL